MDLFNTLRFRWPRNVRSYDLPAVSAERAAFRLHRMLAQYICNAAALESNSLTFIEVKSLLTAGVEALVAQVTNPAERRIAFFLFGSLQQFFFDENKLTSFFLMNRLLMSNGIDTISIPAARAQ